MEIKNYNMTNHCTHEQSQAMKEIGFDMPVRDIFIYDEIKSSSKPINWNNNLTSAPTHAEALEWFREKKGIDGWVLPIINEGRIYFYGWQKDGHQEVSKIDYPTHPQATSALVDKCIEITKKQKA